MMKSKLVVVYQLKGNTCRNFGLAFNPKTFNMYDYTIVYEENRDDIVNPYDVSREFKQKLPSTFEGHPLMTSDIVAIDDKFFYYNDNSWLKLKEEFYI